jgi:16S rRNA (adenine(1408)-N(1))-methyltransferase
MAKANPNKFFIGVDANRKPLEKPSMRATRKPEKGGRPNAMFVQAAVEELPEEFAGVADEIHIHFPWGSLLRAVTVADEAVLRSLRRIAAPKCLLEIVIGIDTERDRSELIRLGVPLLTPEYLEGQLIPRYQAAGFHMIESKEMDVAEWARLETSWARKLSPGANRRVFFLVFTAT